MPLGKIPSVGPMEMFAIQRVVVIYALRIQHHLEPWGTAEVGVLVVAPALHK